MVKFSEHISLDMAQPFDLMSDDEYEFTADGQRMVCFFSQEDAHETDMAFYPKGQGEGKYAIQPRSSLQAVGQILATAASILIDYFETHDYIDTIWISADKNERSRAPLYSRLMKDLAQHLGAEFVTRESEPDWESTVSYTQYGVKRKQEVLQEKYENRGDGHGFLDYMMSPEVVAKLTKAKEPYEVFSDLCSRYGVTLQRAWANDPYIYPEQGIQAAQPFDNDEIEIVVNEEHITEILDWLKDDGPLRDMEYNELVKMLSVVLSHEMVHLSQFNAAGPLYTVRRQDLTMENGNFEYLSNEREIHAHAAAAVDEWLVKGYKPSDILSWLGDTKKLKDHAGESNDFWKYWDYFGSSGSDDPRDVKVWKEFLIRCHDFAQQANARVREDAPFQPKAYINSIDAMRSGKGFGREALKAATTHLKAKGYTGFTTYTKNENGKSQHMLKQLGFVPDQVESRRSHYGSYWRLPTQLTESISPNYFKDGGPTREQNKHTTFDSMGTNDDSISFLYGFDLARVYDEVHKNWPRATNTKEAPEVIANADVYTDIVCEWHDVLKTNIPQKNRDKVKKEFMQLLRGGNMENVLHEGISNKMVKLHDLEPEIEDKLDAHWMSDQELLEDVGMSANFAAHAPENALSMNGVPLEKNRHEGGDWDQAYSAMQRLGEELQLLQNELKG
jgi:hypothetical protein